MTQQGEQVLYNNMRLWIDQWYDTLIISMFRLELIKTIPWLDANGNRKWSRTYLYECFLTHARNTKRLR